MDKNDAFSRINDPVYEPVTNAMLQCGTCAHVHQETTAQCDIYRRKPGYVINGTRPCPYYQKEVLP